MGVEYVTGTSNRTTYMARSKSMQIVIHASLLAPLVLLVRWSFWLERKIRGLLININIATAELQTLCFFVKISSLPCLFLNV